MKPATAKLVTLVKIVLAGGLIFYVASLIHFRDHVMLAGVAAAPGTVTSIPVLLASTGDPVSFQILDTGAPLPAGFPADWQPGMRVAMLRAEFEKDFRYEIGFLSLLRFSDKRLLLMFALLHAVGYLFAFTRWWMLLRAQGVCLPWREVVGIGWMGMFFNNVFPSLVGGDVIRGICIARRTERKTEAVTTLFIDRILGMLGIAVVAGLAILPHLGERGFREAAWMVLLLVAGAGALCSLFFVDAIREFMFHNALMRRLPGYGILTKVAAAGGAYKHQRRVLLYGIGLSMLGNLNFIVTLYGFGMGLGVREVSFGEYLVIVPVCQLISCVPVTPGGWGLGELTYTYFFQRMGESAVYGAAVSLAGRVNSIIISLPGAVLWALSRRPAAVDAVVAAPSPAAAEAGS